MAELNKKLNVKKDGAAEEIKLYSTLDEVNNKGVSLKSDGINCYAAYGDVNDSKASQLNYKPSGSSTSYKVLREAASTSSGDGVTITLKARRNNEDFMQDLPPVKLDPGQKFYINNSNAPTIEGYDFVCCNINNFVPTEDQTINVYYIPQTVPDRTKTDWHRSIFDDLNLTGDLSSQDYANTYAATNMKALFSRSTILAPPKLNMSNVGNAAYMFRSYFSDNNRLKITNIDARGWDVGSLTDVSYMFYEDRYLINVDASTWDTSHIKDMSYMFYNCKALTTLHLSAWDTSSVTTMQSMFNYCGKLTTLDPSAWDTSNVTDMSMMFESCEALTTLDPSNWDTSNVTNMSSMFSKSGLVTLSLSNWDLHSLTDASGMFKFCYNLRTLNLDNWGTRNVTNMSEMFTELRGATVTIDAIDMSSCTNCDRMFTSAWLKTPIHLKNVPRSLNLTNIGGTEGTTYIIDNYLD